MAKRAPAAGSGSKHPEPKRAELVIITGLSGSGKATVLKAFEDLGYYAGGLSGSLSPATGLIGLLLSGRGRGPGFSGAPGFESPPDYLGWLTAVWDALDRTGALPCPVIGASVEVAGVVALASPLARRISQALFRRALHRSRSPAPLRLHLHRGLDAGLAS